MVLGNPFGINIEVLKHVRYHSNHLVLIAHTKHIPTWFGHVTRKSKTPLTTHFDYSTQDLPLHNQVQMGKDVFVRIKEIDVVETTQ